MFATFKKYFSVTLFACSFIIPRIVHAQVIGFKSPDTVCVNADISIQNTSIGGSTFYWNFCSGNLATTPAGINLGNLGNLNGPVYSAIANDAGDYFVFITNVNNGTLTRLNFGKNLTGTPVATNLGNMGVLIKNIEGIQIKRDSLTGNWIGLIAGGENRFLIRLNFGNSLNNTPVAADLGNISGLMSYTHTIYTFNESGNWYSLIVNSDLNTLIRLNFGNSLLNIPTATDLGNIGSLDHPVGFYPIQDNGQWYLFVVSRNNNSISRLSFGNSLLNTPTGIRLGTLAGTLNLPRSITILRDCGQVFGFIVNEGSNDIVRLSFPNGVQSMPAAQSLGNIANFAFPHHISELFRVGDSLYTFILNVNNHSISRLCFASCANASVSSSNLYNPPVYSYNSPGTYNVSLTMNEGQPSQANICREITAIATPDPVISGDTALCQGENLQLLSSADSNCTYTWTGPHGFLSADSSIFIALADTSDSGIYTLTTSVFGCDSKTMSKNVIVLQSPLVSLGNDTTICPGQSFLLDAANAGCSYIWNTGEITQTLLAEAPGLYTVGVSNGNCLISDTILLNDCGSELWCPTAFSPDYNGLNDTFKPKSQALLSSVFTLIYNRWGQLVFESNDQSHLWDGTINGTPCPAGIYFYTITYEIGTDPAYRIRKVKKGSVYLLR